MTNFKDRLIHCVEIVPIHYGIQDNVKRALALNSYNFFIDDLTDNGERNHSGMNSAFMEESWSYRSFYEGF